jgi:predicted nuclease of restriction endonuclease-like (RecB) superfamily
LPWGQNITLLTKLKTREERLLYGARAVTHGWSRPLLTHHIELRTLEREGKAVTNFDQRLPKPQSDLARETLKDPYRFDFLSLGSEAEEREIEAALITHITKFLLELGAGFAFVGRQVHLEVGGRDFYIDLPRVVHTFDTAENRFALEFLGQIRRIIDRVDRLARSKAKPGVFWTRAVRDCEAMRRVLGPFERHDMWNDVGRMGHVPIASSVLQRRRGYKEALRHHLALRAAARIPFDRATAERLLGLKDVATLYELWCYFAVVDALSAVIGRRPDDADAMKVRDEVDLWARLPRRVGWWADHLLQPVVHAEEVAASSLRVAVVGAPDRRDHGPGARSALTHPDQPVGRGAGTYANLLNARTCDFWAHRRRPQRFACAAHLFAVARAWCCARTRANDECFPDCVWLPAAPDRMRPDGRAHERQ